MRKKIGIILVFMMLVTSFQIIFPIETVKATENIFYVGGSGPGNYSTIQSAIDATSSGDTVYVYNGTYYENIVINKTNISVIGEDKNTTIIESENEKVVFINKEKVNITNFTIRSGWNGIYIRSDHCTIKSNIIKNNGYCGILLFFSNHTTIRDNIIYNNSYCIQSWYSHYCLIDTNILNDSANTTWFYESNYNIIRENNFYGDWLGIGLLYFCQGNKIYHNNFFGFLMETPAHDDGLNTWDDGYPSGGNYWSAYDEPIEGAYDNNSDGIVDKPYQIPETWNNPNGNNFDYYPLITPFEISNPFADIYVDDDALPNWYDATHVHTIQEGINNASYWDTVFVYNGTYYENVVIDKIINLIGEDKNNTIIDGGNKKDTVRLEKNSTTFESFTVMHGSYHGIHLVSSSTSIINNCVSHSNEVGIYLAESHLNVVSNCFVYNNSWIGIGVFNYSTNNVIFNNNILNNGVYGIELSISNNNTIYHNNFFSTGGFDGCNNDWDNGYPIGGNYWTNYSGADNFHGSNQDIPGADGLGDIPYPIYGGINQDDYPLMEPWVSEPTAMDISIDIKPGDYPNTINPKSKGKLIVAILTTEFYNATEFDPGSIDFLGTSPSMWNMDDVDDDGDSDMLLLFKTEELNFSLLVDEGDEYPYAYLSGETNYGVLIEGKDTVRLVGHNFLKQTLARFIERFILQIPFFEIILNQII